MPKFNYSGGARAEKGHPAALSQALLEAEGATMPVRRAQRGGDGEGA